MVDQALNIPQPMTRDPFLAFLDQQQPPAHWELIDGVPQMMTGGTAAHSRIIGNLFRALDRAAGARGCEAMTSFFAEIDDKNVFEPDVLVRCGPLSPQARSAVDPIIVVEVLSASTMRRDRVLKFEHYRRLASVRQIVFVYQDSVRVESWMREGADWLAKPLLLVQLDDGLAVPVLGTSIPVAEVYRGVTPSPLIEL